MLIQNINHKYCCDKCLGVFEGKDAKQVDPIPNMKVELAPLNMVFVDEGGIIRGSSSMPSFKGDKLLACPLCLHVHLFGFSAPPAEKVLVGA